MQKETIMKKYIPFVTLITLGCHLLYTLVMGIVADDAAIFLLWAAVLLAVPLVAEIVGRIINAKAHKAYADIIAVYIVMGIGIIPTICYIISDLGSEGFMAGLGAFIMLLTVVPMAAMSLVVNTVILIRRRVLARETPDEPSHEVLHEAMPEVTNEPVPEADVTSAESKQNAPAETER